MPKIFDAVFRRIKRLQIEGSEKWIRQHFAAVPGRMLDSSTLGKQANLRHIP
jgi:hypothetical protein